MDNKIAQVKIFFDDTHRYIHNNAIIKLRKEILLETTGKITNKKIIDIGCGNGEISIDLLDSNKVTFVDLSEKMLQEVKNNIPLAYSKNSILINSSAEDLKVDEKYDIVICFGLLAHVQNITTMTDKLIEFCISKGLIFIQFSDSSKFLTKLLTFKYTLRSYFKKDLTYKVNNISFNDLQSILLKNQIIIKRRISYFPVLPLMSLLSYSLRYKLLQTLYKHLGDKFGSEVILILEKL